MGEDMLGGEWTKYLGERDTERMMITEDWKDKKKKEGKVKMREEIRGDKTEIDRRKEKTWR